MHRAIKVITVAGAIAIGSLATDRADAQLIGWNVIRPTACFLTRGVNPNGDFVYTGYIYTDTFTVTFADPVAIGAALQWCYTRSAFWANFNGSPIWDMVWVTPGMK
jgi:hypothetical protein